MLLWKSFPWSISTSISSMDFAQVNFNVSYIKNLNLSIFIGTLVGSTRTFSCQCIFILLYILTRSEVTWNWKICNTSSLHIKKSKFKIFQSLNFEFQIIGIRIFRNSRIFKILIFKRKLFDIHFISLISSYSCKTYSYGLQ